MKKLILGALATLAAVAPAQAAITFDVTNGSTIAFANSAGVAGAITFNAIAAGTAYSGGGTVFNGSQDAAYAEPFGSDKSNYLGIQGGQTATFSTGTATKFFSIYIGSIDNFNSIEFFDAANNSLGTVLGTAFGNPSNGDQTSPENNRWVVFQDSSTTIAKAVLKSGSNAFEVDNVAFSNAVPEPATWGMMLVGFGAVGSAMRRRRVMKPSFV